MNIEVGKSYKSRMGRTVQIIGSFKDIYQRTCYKGDNGFTYGPDGKINPEQTRPEDLLSSSV